MCPGCGNELVNGDGLNWCGERSDFPPHSPEASVLAIDGLPVNLTPLLAVDGFADCPWATLSLSMTPP